jgi:hypothetical protein
MFIRRSKIYQSIINNSSTLSHSQDQNFTINYRSPLRHRRIRRKILDGAGDENSIEQKQIDFTELEQIFDNAIRNRLPLELYKEKPQSKEIIRTQHEKVQSLINHNPVETRIDLSTVEPIEEIQCCLIANIKQHKIVFAITFVTFSALLGFFSVFIFIK